MNFQGTQVLPQGVQRVWDALLDPAVLQQSIAGCESFERVSDTEYTSKVKVGIGPVSARFASTMTLLDLSPPHGCTLRFAGQGGVAGFGKGEARVTLVAQGESETRLDWSADAQVGGKLAQLGSRLIEGSVRKMSEDFFQRFAEQLAQARAGAQAGAVAEAEGASVAPAGGGVARVAAIAAACGALAMLALLWITR